jgi:hypothetical protein
MRKQVWYPIQVIVEQSIALCLNNPPDTDLQRSWMKSEVRFALCFKSLPEILRAYSLVVEFWFPKPAAVVRVHVGPPEQKEDT